MIACIKDQYRHINDTVISFFFFFLIEYFLVDLDVWLVFFVWTLVLQYFQPSTRTSEVECTPTLLIEGVSGVRPMWLHAINSFLNCFTSVSVVPVSVLHHRLSYSYLPTSDNLRKWKLLNIITHVGVVLVFNVDMCRTPETLSIWNVVVTRCYIAWYSK